MERFEITLESCTTGFHEHVILDILKPIEAQLNRRKLVSRGGWEKGNVNALRDVIERNSSLRVSFGWSFESTGLYEEMMEECLKEVIPRYNMFLGSMTSDLRNDWLGFIPFNAFDKLAYEHLGIYGLIIFNNELIDFQTEVIKYISSHRYFLQHSLLRNPEYRFEYYRAIRHKPDDLSEAFRYYIESAVDIAQMGTVTRQQVEEDIGCHYLRHPDTFFELLEFYKLKGIIHE